MKALTEQEHTEVSSHAQAIDNVFGLPPGTILKIILGLLNVLGGLSGTIGASNPPTK